MSKQYEHYNSFEQLRTLSIHDVELSQDDLDCLADVIGLKGLVIYRTSLPSGWCTSISQCSSLVVLEIHSCEISTKDIRSISKLPIESLAIGDIELGLDEKDRLVQQVRCMPQLRCLTFRNIDLSSNQEIELMKIPNLDLIIDGIRR